MDSRIRDSLTKFDVLPAGSPPAHHRADPIVIQSIGNPELAELTHELTRHFYIGTFSLSSSQVKPHSSHRGPVDPTRIVNLVHDFGTAGPNKHRYYGLAIASSTQFPMPTEPHRIYAVDESFEALILDGEARRLAALEWATINERPDAADWIYDVLHCGKSLQYFS